MPAKAVRWLSSSSTTRTRVGGCSVSIVFFLFPSFYSYCDSQTLRYIGGAQPTKCFSAMAFHVLELFAGVTNVSKTVLRNGVFRALGRGCPRPNHRAESKF